MIGDLVKLERRFGSRVVIVGVHSPKFDNEKNLEMLRKWCARYHVTHPVMHDPAFRLWDAFGVRAWPTLVVVDPTGRVVASVAGEGHFETLSRTIDKLLAAHAERTPERGTEGERPWVSPTAAPTGVAVAPNGQVAVSDSVNHVVWIFSASDGQQLGRVGRASAGWVDGAPDEAAFDAPQGLTYWQNAWYVADTGNHRLRRIAPVSWRVTTVAGTGARGMARVGRVAGLAAALASPWGLAGDDQALYVAMAGLHQIWRYWPDGSIEWYAGTGYEALVDGDGKHASFSQPSGLSLTGGLLWVADAEDSAIRCVALAQGEVRTEIGRGLFDFGDRDGPFEQALLQHPLGILAWDDQQVFVADTYNHKIKRLDLRTRTVSTVVDGHGLAPTWEPLNEPGQMARQGGDLLVADTNNGRVVAYSVREQNVRVWADFREA